MENNILNTPVLFLAFNRPEKTQLVFDVIRVVKPNKLYVAVDGPRSGNKLDIENINKVKDIVKQIDWKCEAKYLFHEKNLGCSLSGFKAWDWIFKFEDDMIFIEDDGLLSPSFFYYAQELLEKYRFDNRVAYISSENFGLKYNESNSYFFSRFSGGTYGMATWKRIHELYDYKLTTYKETVQLDSFRKSFINKFHFDFSKRKFENYIKNGGNTYDLQIVYLLHKYNLYNIIPNLNMCSNIGFDNQGSNTNVDPTSEFALKHGNRLIYDMNSIFHPSSLSVNNSIEYKNFKLRVLYGNSLIKSMFEFYLHRFYSPVYQFLKRIIKILKNEL
jgi:hypothetical protein